MATHYHKYETVGWDPVTGLPNIYQCQRCGIVKSVAPSKGGGSRFRNEYSTHEGLVLGEDNGKGKFKIPPCEPAGSYWVI